MEIDRLAHLMNRAGFGLHPADVTRYKHLSEGEVVHKLLEESRRIEPLNFLDDPRPPEGDVGGLKALKEALNSRKDLQSLNLAWIDQMASTQAVLREKMTLFWHNHFATTTKYAFLMQLQNNTLRKHALGNFKELLLAVAQDPVMILYLNNQQNKKRAPNENFAREVMVLFTLGEGNGYTEQDIKEAARAFTGWHINGRGEFELSTKHHDTGSKTIFGYTGHWGGEDVIKFLLLKPETAFTIAAKFYRFFVNEIPDPAIVQGLADRLYASEYDIGDMVETAFTSSWFYRAQQRGAVVKSPAALLVQLKRLTGASYHSERPVLKLQRALGQMLFFPPNVAGWPGGTSWIDSSTLLIRMRLPGMLLSGSPPGVQLYGGTRPQKKDLPLWGTSKRSVEPWNLTNALQDSSDPVPELLDALITAPRDGIDPTLLRHGDSPAVALGRILSLPEFQLA